MKKVVSKVILIDNTTKTKKIMCYTAALPHGTTLTHELSQQIKQVFENRMSSLTNGYELVKIVSSSNCGKFNTPNGLKQVYAKKKYVYKFMKGEPQAHWTDMFDYPLVENLKEKYSLDELNNKLNVDRQ
jgi:hypothetical protein